MPEANPESCRKRSPSAGAYRKYRACPLAAKYRFRATGTPKAAAPVRTITATASPNDADEDVPDIARIVAIIKDCDEAEVIETRVLDRKDVLNRVLLPLYVVNRHVGGTMGLTSGDIEKVTEQLGVKVNISGASTMLSGRAKSYVTGDAVRKKGGTVRYKLNRRGVQYFEEVLSGTQ
jgi:hypothetical protein